MGGASRSFWANFSEMVCRYLNVIRSSEKLGGSRVLKS